MPDRFFTEEEIREIVRRASRQQAEDAEHREARDHGLTLDDLERLGAEVGLDPAYLRRAADEVQTGRRAVAESATQTDTHVVVERRIEHPFTLEAWEDTVIMLRQMFGSDMSMWYGGGEGGRVEQVGRAHEWVHTSQLGIETRISASDRDGTTRLLLSQRVGLASSNVEGLAYGAILGLLVGVAGLVAGEVLGGEGLHLFLLIATMILTTVAAAPLITRIDKRWREKKQERLKRIASDIERTFAEAAPRPEVHAAPEPTGAHRATPRLDLDALPDEGEAETGAARTRTRS